MKVSKVTDFRVFREKAGLSIKEASEVFGKSERTIYRWEKQNMSGNSNIQELITSYVVQNNLSFASKAQFRFIDLFAGIGGLRKAFESIGGKCVFTSEWDSACRKTYQENFVCDHPINGDIRDVDFDKDVPEYDLLVAGFPCQPFSLAGVSKKNSLGKAHGFQCDTQGTLFFDVAQMLERHRPKAFVLENVKNLLSHDKGNTFKVIMKTLTEELGYHVDYKIVDAKYWVPQHRERLLIIGFKENHHFTFKNLITPTEVHRLESILHPEDGSEVAELPYTYGSLANVDDKYTLSDRLWNYLQNYAEKHRAKGNGFGFGLFGPNDVARTLSARYYKDGSEILIKQHGGKNPRRLTPRECARLMGFDTPGGKPFVIPVSDTQAYKQFGNSVAVPAVEAVANYLRPYLMQAIQSKVENIETKNFS